MEQQLDEQTTLRDTVAAAIDTVEAATTAPEQQQEAAPAAAPVTDGQPQETDAQRDERLRDEAGRFAKQSDKPKVSAAQPPKATTPQAPNQAPSAPAAAEPAAAKPKYPTTWKKGLEAHWESLPPELHAEIMRRESDAARGVSVYKAEWDKARPIVEAVAPFMPLLQHHKIAPDQWITNLGRAHQTLALGTPEQRIQAFSKLAQDYGVPLQALTGQTAQEGQQQQPHQPARFTAPAPLTREEVQQLIAQQTQEQTLRMMGQQEVARLKSDGQHQYLEEVRETMAQLLEAGVIPEGDDALHQAYETAMALPQHRHLLEASRAEQRKADEAKAAAEKAALAARARSNAVSVRSSTPSANFAQSNGDDSIRSAISAAIDQVGTGRI